MRAGLNISDLTVKADGLTIDLDSRVGFQLGGIVDIPLFNGFYIQPGLFVTSRGASLGEGKFHDEGKYYDYETKISPIYLNIPVLASFRGDVCDWCNLQFNVGPYIGVGLGGKVKTPDEGVTVKFPFFGESAVNEPRGDMSRFDMGLSFGVGATFIKHWYVGFQYDMGLTNIALDNHEMRGTKVHNGNFAIQVGYNF